MLISTVFVKRWAKENCCIYVSKIIASINIAWLPARAPCFSEAAQDERANLLIFFSLSLHPQKRLGYKENTKKYRSLSSNNFELPCWNIDILLLKLINNSSSLNNVNHDRDGVGISDLNKHRF